MKTLTAALCAALAFLPVYQSSHSQELKSAQVTLAWDPSPDADVVDYRLYTGPSSGNYDESISLGNVTNTVYSKILPGRSYFFVVTALNAGGAESDPSNEISYSAPSLENKVNSGKSLRIVPNEP